MKPHCVSMISSSCYCVFCESSAASLRGHVDTIEPSKRGQGLQATHNFLLMHLAVLVSSS